ncbi:MAG: CDP-glycerol glycerophosphotransferase family protein [Eubacterium sp.]|nr:CDP-glycerol glycerophosphotransferase family protein [Eubacterium sp.]
MSRNYIKSLNNLLTKGPTRVIASRAIRKGTPETDEFAARIRKETENADRKESDRMLKMYKRYYSLSRSVQLMPEHMRDAGEDAEHISRAEELRDQVLYGESPADEERLEQIRAELIGLETDNYMKYIKALYIKKIIPEVYRQFSERDVEDKILFLQPRRTLNPSCRYMYRTLQAMGRSEVRLCELYHGRVSLTEEYNNCVEFIKDMATARAVVTHEFNEYFGYLDIRKETKLIQLWHGCGIIKGLGMSTAGMEGSEFKTMDEYREYPEFEGYDLVTIPGEAERRIFEEFMGRPHNSPEIQAVGVSRTDEFFSEKYREKCYKKIYERIPAARQKKIILYAPTFRGLEPERYAPDKLDIGAFAEKLSDRYILVIKHHQTAKILPEIPEKYRGSFAFDMTHGSGMDINELMTVSDICITDYSSLVFEYSLFERPIVFFMFDKDEYRDSRGMYYTYDELAECGPIFETNEGVINYIDNIDDGFDRSKVASFRDRYMNACDGKSTERIIDFIYRA